MAASSDRYVVISTDGHCGADVRDYKPYLEARYHDDFDRWADNYHDGWLETDSEVDPDRRMGQASSAAPLNWDSKRRLRLMEEQGVVAEVLFPNTAPPFYPSGVITTPGPRTPEEYEYRWAGLRAHNRWLVDFCSDAPGRRAGLAQVFLDNVDDTVEEIRWARDAGLMGVLLPAPHVLKIVNLYYPEYDAVWAVCQELDMPVCIHSHWVTESSKVAGPGADLAGAIEMNFYPRRQIGHLIAAAVFERFPNLKLAATELNDASAVPAWLAQLDGLVEHALQHPGFAFQTEAARRLGRRPSEYFESNVFLGGPTDLLHAITAGSPNLMFGADLPHAEGTWPYTIEVLRLAMPQLSEHDRRQFLAERPARVFGFNLALLQGSADRVGPLAEQLRTPLPLEELPRWPEDTRCVIVGQVALPA
jgi:predicted TIM-barrel fold metal-dependent hydrolase